MWGAAVSPPAQYGGGGGGGPGGPVLAGPGARHLRPQSSYSLPHGSAGAGRWGWAAGSHVSSFDRRQAKLPPQPVRPAPVRPSYNRSNSSNVSSTLEYREALVFTIHEFVHAWANVSYGRFLSSSRNAYRMLIAYASGRHAFSLSNIQLLECGANICVIAKELRTVRALAMMVGK